MFQGGHHALVAACATHIIVFHHFQNNFLFHQYGQASRISLLYSLILLTKERGLHHWLSLGGPQATDSITWGATLLFMTPAEEATFVTA